MLTIFIAIFAGVLLTHLLASALKAGVLVIVVLGVLYLARGVSFEALVDDGARALYDAAGDVGCSAHHRRGERI